MLRPPFLNRAEKQFVQGMGMPGGGCPPHMQEPTGGRGWSPRVILATGHSGSEFRAHEATTAYESGIKREENNSQLQRVRLGAHGQKSP